MKQENAGKVLVQYSFVISVLLCIVLAACNGAGPKPVGPPTQPPPKTVRLAGHGACPNSANPPSPLPLPINIELNATGLVDPANEAIIVCPYDTLIWFSTPSSTNPVASFTIDFTNKGNPGKLGTPETLNSTSGLTTGGMVVGRHNSSDPHLKDYLYSIKIYDSHSNVLFSSTDPHVIPMGN
jgi:hypothetical protein